MSGKTTLVEIGCDVPQTNELLRSLHSGLQTTGTNIQQVLPSVLRLFEPNLNLPSKVSNLVRKVRKKIDRARQEGNEADIMQANIPITTSIPKLSATFQDKHITPEILKTCSFPQNEDGTIEPRSIDTYWN